MGIAGGVLVDGDEAGHAAAALIFRAHGVAGPLGSDHDHVDVGARFDQAEVDVETVGKGQRRAGLHVGGKIIGIDRGLMLVGGEHHQNVGPFGCFLVRQNLEAGGLSLLGGCGTGAQGDSHFLDARIAQVLRMGVALRAIAQNGDLFAGDQVQVGIGVVIDFHWFSPWSLPPERERG